MDICKNLKREHINAYDIETYEKNGIFVPYCVCVTFNEETFGFYNKKVILRSLFKIFTKINNLVILYVHNLDFDGFLILEEVSKCTKFKIDFLIHKMKIYYLKIIFSKKIIEFRCSKKILPAQLKNIAEDFNLSPKLEYPYSFINENTLFYKGELVWKNLNWKYIDIHKYSIQYCSRDVEITYKFINHLRNIIWQDQKIDLIESLSISSLSLKLFTKNFNYRKVPLKTKKTLDLLLREAYFGGRCEVFGNTNGKIYHYDFPGMYGICMKEKFPLGHPTWYPTEKIDMNNLMPGYYTIAWKSSGLRIPILPVKNEFGKLIFPNGIYSGTYWFEEINIFVKYGGKILSIDRALVYNDYNYVFDKFVNYFDTFRKRGGVYKTLGKLIINSLYGKLGSGIKNVEYLIAYNQDELNKVKKQNEVIDIIELNKIYIVEIKKKCKIQGLNVGLAAAITSKARIRLFEAMNALESTGGRMLYCDTDSVFVEYKNTADATIFKWDRPDSIYEGGVFALPKTYALKNKNQDIVKIKGIPKSSINFKNFKDHFLNKELLIFSELFQTKKSEFKIRAGSLEKKINLTNYDKRIFDEERINTHI